MSNNSLRGFLRGNPLSATPLLDARDSQTYSYDSASRLIAYERHDGSNQTWPDLDLGREWTMDGLGNRRQTDTTDSGGNPTVWQWLNTSFNEYYSVAGASLDHDANGNLISEPGVSTRTFRWDALNRLKDDNGVYVTAYLYDADNRRVKKDLAAAGADVEYAYEGWLTLEEFAEGQSNLKRQYVHGRQMDELVLIDVNGNGDSTASGSGDARYYYHQNLIHSVGALSGASGAIVEAYEYDPYGRHVLIRDGDSDGHVDFDATDARTVLGVSAAGSPFTFTGRDYDAEIDKHHYRNRAYSWQAERFISRDPAGYNNGPNIYEYVGNGPSSRMDPNGLSWLSMMMCKKRVPKPGYQLPKPNGCGPAKPGWLAKVIIDGLPALSWEEACNTHDNCYGTCNNLKSGCDFQLGNDIRKTCGQWLMDVPWYLKPVALPYYTLCLSAAPTYAVAVGLGGTIPYWSGQDAACDCCKK